MDIYFLERKEGCPNSGLGGYDQYEAFVICAKSSAEARRIAFETTGKNSISGEFEGNRAENVWKNPALTSCSFVGGAGPSRTKNGSHVVLAEYHPG